MNAAVKDVTVSTLRAAGHSVVVSDLYRQNFNPVISRDDILGELYSRPQAYGRIQGVHGKGVLGVTGANSGGGGGRPPILAKQF